jgi:hypothetical protein
MSYIENERQKWATGQFQRFFKDPGNGIFMGKPRYFVLSDTCLNLWKGIRSDVISYFKENNIVWWKGKDKLPSGHILSSQIACLNHLFYIRNRHDLATSILQKINPDIISDETFNVEDDKSYIEFEFVGKDCDKIERGEKRGANCTSLDAAMIGKKKNGTKILVAIEWKYTESYKGNSLSSGESGKKRLGNYHKLLNLTDWPIIFKKIEDLYYEPYYQLMRQTLLAKKIVENKSCGVSDWIHLHIIPCANIDLLNSKTSPNLTGENLGEIWKSCLKDRSKYKIISPEVLLSPVINDSGFAKIYNYLKKRYW